METVNAHEYAEGMDDNRLIGLLPRRWKSVEFASLDGLRAIVEQKQHRYFVWPDEGRFTANGTWQFYSNYRGFEPLIVDVMTASAVTMVHDAMVKPTSRERLTEFVSKGRGHFGHVVQFSWKYVR